MKDSIFEKLKSTDDNDKEFWTARTLMEHLGYDTWSKFTDAINRAIESAKTNEVDPADHFIEITRPSTGGRPGGDYVLSRYACYLVAQNGDVRKPEIAAAQAYFIIQTRKQEQNEQLLEDQRRVMLRDEISKHNVSLSEAAQNAGVTQYAIFQNYGYMGLYGGLKAGDIHTFKKLKKSQKILDHMGSEELAANLFRATQADAKLRRDKINNEYDAYMTHYGVGQMVRDSIKEIGGNMPEDLPAADSISQARKRLKSDEKKKLGDKNA
jgi:DNA-damage-inducible protein D